MTETETDQTANAAASMGGSALLSETSMDRPKLLWSSDRVVRRTKIRLFQEYMFKLAGLGAILIAALFLFFMLAQLVRDGYSGFAQTYITLDITYSADRLGNPDPSNPSAFRQQIMESDPRLLILDQMQARFPDIRSRRDSRAALSLFSSGVRGQIRAPLLKDPGLLNKTVQIDLLASDDIDQWYKGRTDTDVPETDRRLKNQVVTWAKTFEEAGALSVAFNVRFLTSGDSSDPELAGIWGAVVGSALTLTVTFLIAFPLGVMCAIYLEEFAPQNKLTDLIEVNINNLAAVPSIVFGLLGLAFFLGFMNLPRSAPLVGGMTLALMTLPTIIIAARASIRAVPSTIRDAAGALGASRMQTTFHHVMPFAMPGIMTGTIIGMAQALGETAPLLMIGMVAFIVDIPTGINDAATVLPVQVFLWADSPERAFQEKTAAAILVLLFFLVLMNSLALWVRHRFEKKR